MGNKSIIMGFSTPPTLDDLTEIAQEIIDDLPKELEKRTGKLRVEVEEFPDQYIEQELELETPFDAFGYYQSSGPAIVNGCGGQKTRQDILCLYRRPILDAWCETADDLTDLLNRIILHEIGHHFGYTETEMELLEEEMPYQSGDADLIIC